MSLNISANATTYKKINEYLINMAKNGQKIPDNTKVNHHTIIDYHQPDDKTTTYITYKSPSGRLFSGLFHFVDPVHFDEVVENIELLTQCIVRYPSEIDKFISNSTTPMLASALALLTYYNQPISKHIIQKLVTSIDDWDVISIIFMMPIKDVLISFGQGVYRECLPVI